MTNEKARELFSKLYEGSLDSGLRGALLDQFKSNPELGSEYESFSKTMESLSELGRFTAQIPEDLNELISRRIDKAAWDAKQKRSIHWPYWVRSVALGAIGCAAVFGVFLSFSHRNLGPTGSSITPGNDQLSIESINGAVVVNLAPSDRETVVVRTEPTNQILRSRAVEANQKVEIPLVNKNSTVATFQVEVEGAARPMTVAVPGNGAPKDSDGVGSIEDFAYAVAAFYKAPVVVQGSGNSSSLKWSFHSTNTIEAATQALQGTGYSADMRSGIVTISKN